MRGTAKTARHGIPLALAVVVAAFAISSAQATQSPLDTTFGSGGKVTTSLSSMADVANAVVVQPDGKIVAAGSARNGSQFALARYNPDGSLDTSFGSGGTVVATYGPGSSYATALALLPDGRVVAAGTSFSGGPTGLNFTLVRYNANGSLDTTFGTNGVVTTDILGHNDLVTGLALQPDGKIVALGQAQTASSAWQFALTRYNANGTIDSSFGTNGKVTTSLGSGDSVANALIRQPDGKLVAAGYLGSATNSVFALARYTADGLLDSTFGSGGLVTTPFVGASTNVVRALALQPDGKLVAAGYTDSAVGLARYEPNGSADTTFGMDGNEPGVGGSANALVIEPDGKIVTAGGSNQGFLLSRYNADGSVDDSFGDGGLTTTVFGSQLDSANAIAFQPDGKIVAVGTTNVAGPDWNFAVARYLGVTLTVVKTGNGFGTVRSNPPGVQCGPTCAGSFAPVSVTLTAKPSARSAFAGWSGDCSGRQTTCTLTMSTDRSVTAKFSAACIVPKVLGKKLSDAKRAIRQAHCSVGKVSSAFSATVKRGRVISQKPRAGTKLRARSRVRLTASKGRR